MLHSIDRKRSNSNLEFPSETSSDFGKCENCLSENGPFLRTSICSHHFYCRKCITNPSQKKLINLIDSSCPKCKRYFTTLNKKITSENINCNLCYQISENSKPKCKNHSYCKVCREFLIKNDTSHLLNFNNCNDCILSLNEFKGVINRHPKRRTSISPESPHRRKSLIVTNIHELHLNFDKLIIKSDSIEIPDDPIGLVATNSTENISKIYCDCHNGAESDPSNVFGFLCNHNICINCLILTCTEQIIYFLQHYQTDSSYIKKNFSYFCHFKDCEAMISVPTKLIVEKLKQKLNDPSVSNHFNPMIAFIVGDEFQAWIPYFDGLNPWFLF